MAVAFDIQKFEVYGQPVPVIPGVVHMLNSTSGTSNTGAGQYHISDSGSLVYAPGGIIPNPQDLLVWVDKTGNEELISTNTMPYFITRLSPDGQKIIYGTIGAERQIWEHDISRDISTLVVSEGKATYPIWTPDGNMIVFGLRDHSNRNLYMVPADGSKAIEQVTTSQNIQSPSSFSPDGNLLAYLENKVDDSGSNYDILIYDFRDKSTTPFATTEHQETFPEFSPDGRWIAYCTNEEGQNEVYVRSSSGNGETIKVSRKGGHSPLWARSGRQVFYRRGSQMWAVDVQAEPNFSVGKPRLLFENGSLTLSSTLRSYDISLDDRRFLMVKVEERKPRPVTEMILIQNWFEEIKHLVPTKN